MAAIAVTYTFSNSTTADATQVNQNFQDIVDGLSNGTKDISVSAGTFAGNVSISGNTTIGNASGDDLTVTASLASTIPIKTTNSYDIGSSTLGLRALYFGANSQTVNIKGSGSMSATWTFTLPVSAGTSGYYLKTDGSGVSSWSAFTPPTQQTFTSGSSATYTTPAGVKYIRVRMVGGGGGGSGSGSGATSGNSGGAGGNTTFGSSLLTANGGNGGTFQNNGGTGGTVSIASPAYGTGFQGGSGDPTRYQVGASQTGGAMGAPTPFGGAGGGSYTGNGIAAIANTGSGGGGGTADAAGEYAGSGGGAGGYIDAIIPSPSATYTYTVGAAGTAGGAGTSGFNGGAGGAGYIEVTEYYQ